MKKGSKLGYKTIQDADDASGWVRDDDGDYVKTIPPTPTPTVIFRDGDKWVLRMFAPPCKTLHECKTLAHKTARLWAGDEV